METKYTYEQLIEKIALARMHIQRIKRGVHKISCPLEDLESYAPCNCGEDANNKPINDALEALKL